MLIECSQTAAFVDRGCFRVPEGAHVFAVRHDRRDNAVDLFRAFVFQRFYVVVGITVDDYIRHLPTQHGIAEVLILAQPHKTLEIFGRRRYVRYRLLKTVHRESVGEQVDHQLRRIPSVISDFEDIVCPGDFVDVSPYNIVVGDISRRNLYVPLSLPDLDIDILTQHFLPVAIFLFGNPEPYEHLRPVVFVELQRERRTDVINNANIRPGDVIIGLASYGQATYEKEYNGGMGSNGLTSARHDVFAKYLAEKYPESYDKAVPEELVYSGNLKLTDAVEGSPLDAGKLVLSPTRTYAPVVKKLLDALRPEIHGMVHCSGGAQTKVLHFVGNNCRVVKDNLFPVPPLFKTIKEQSGTDWEEMYKVFNMGHRLEVYLSPEHAEEVIAISKSFNIDAKIVGRIEESDKKELIIKSEFGEFKY